MKRNKKYIAVLYNLGSNVKTIDIYNKENPSDMATFKENGAVNIPGYLQVIFERCYHKDIVRAVEKYKAKHNIKEEYKSKTSADSVAIEKIPNMYDRVYRNSVLSDIPPEAFTLGKMFSSNDLYDTEYLGWNYYREINISNCKNMAQYDLSDATLYYKEQLKKKNLSNKALDKEVDKFFMDRQSKIDKAIEDYFKVKAKKLK